MHMRSVITIFSAIAVTACAQGAPSGAVPSSQELRALYVRMLDGIRTKDTSALNSVLDPGYMFVNGAFDVVASRSARLRAIALDTVTETDTLRLDSLDIRNFNGSAIGIAKVREVMTYSDTLHSEDVRSTVMFVRDAAGAWRIGATHTSAIPGTHVDTKR